MTLARLLDTTCHTTGHAGPHPAVRRIQLRAHDHRRKPEPRKVGIRQSERESGRLREPPRAVRATRGLRRQVLAHTPFAKFAKSRSTLLPLLPHHRPESTA